MKEKQKNPKQQHKMYIELQQNIFASKKVATVYIKCN